ncbi:alpha/beta hydrolase family protein [Microbulbifer sp. VTAC004]|uniref:alpha/beta hydrolase family protein n=1 Tax=Microbulbifer sp. VTAC004 TaxID=3243386 RepID=UPI004039BF3A
MQILQSGINSVKLGLKSLILATSLSSTYVMAGGIDGIWKATFQIANEETLPVVIHIDQENGDWTGVLDSPSQGKYGMEMSTLEIRSNSIAFEVEDLHIKYEGAYNNDVDLIFGTLTQRKSLPLNFRRAADGTSDTPKNRPQTPKLPFPYAVEEVSFKNKTANITLSGTLTKPTSTVKATAVLISGSGPQDRDETLFGHKPFAVIADYLTRQGYAVLRYDDRGIGESTGDFFTATSADFASDTSAAVDYLNSRSDLPKGKVGLIGHSEGGMIAPIVASNREDIAFAILLAGPGVKIPQLLVDQWYKDRKFNGLDKQKLKKLRELDKEIFSLISQLEEKETISGEIHQLLLKSARLKGNQDDELEAEVEQLKRQYSTPWFRYFLKFNPEPYLEQTKAPLLALNGSLDFQVNAKMNLNNMHRVLSRTGHPDFQTFELEQMNHLFQIANKGSSSEYAEIEESFSPKALKIMSSWLNERFGLNP